MEVIIEDNFRNATTNSLKLGKRARTCLKEAGLSTIGAVIGMTDRQLLKLPNMGKNTLREVRSAINLLGDQRVGVSVPVHKPEGLEAAIRTATPDEKTQLILKLADEVKMHENGHQRLIRVIGRISQLCQENGLGDKVSAIILEEGLRDD